jgi:hypothetical protein
MTAVLPSRRSFRLCGERLGERRAAMYFDDATALAARPLDLKLDHARSRGAGASIGIGIIARLRIGLLGLAMLFSFAPQVISFDQLFQRPYVLRF